MRRSTAVSSGFFLALLVLLGSSAALALKVKSKRADGVDFSKFKTYAWRAPGSEGSGSPSPDEDTDKRIRAAADESLAKRGLRKLAEGEENPDLWLSYSVGWNSTFAHEGWAFTDDWMVVDFSRTTDQAVLVLEFTDAGTGKAAWLGWARQAANTPQSLEAMRRNADDAVIKILKKYPSR
jgi:hypothetical protein